MGPIADDGAILRTVTDRDDGLGWIADPVSRLEVDEGTSVSVAPISAPT